MSVPCRLGDPEPVRLALEAVVGRNAELSARIGPVRPVTVEVRGRFGRTHVEEVLIGGEVVHWADLDGSGHFSVVVHHAPGWPALAMGPPTPVGSRLTDTDADWFGLDLSLAASPAQAAAEVTALLVLVFADAYGTDWQIDIVDNT